MQGKTGLLARFRILVKDNWGKYFYIRDLKRNIFWSATYKPVMHPYQHFSVVHGIGYSKFTQQFEEIESELTVFVSAHDPVEVFQLTLTNHSSEARELDITSYAEWLLGFSPDEHREFHKLFIETSADVAEGTVTPANACGVSRTKKADTTTSIGLIPHLCR